MIGYRPSGQPEPRSLRLLGRSLRTLLSAIVLQLIEVCRPFLAVQRNRRTGPKLGWAGHGEWLDPWPHWAPHGRRRHIDARRGLWPEVIGRVRAVVCPRRQDLPRNGLAELDALRFRRAIGDRDT